MTHSGRSATRRRVVVCGGGVAGVEALLALRALAPISLEVDLVSPNGQFVYQPLAVAAPFDLADSHLLDLTEIAREQRAELHVDSLAGVEPGERRVRLASGGVISYDALVIAVGARRSAWLQGALNFAGAGDVPAFRALLERLASGSEQRLCFVSPAGVSWTLPLYELALLTASHLVDLNVIGVELVVATPETDPLALFGPAASRLLRNLLSDRGIALKTGARAQKIEHGKLDFDPPVRLEVDQVVTLAQLEGPAVPGIPSDAAGFIPVDEHSRIAGLQDVYAAGDGTTFPVKQGGIATQQADAAAEAIAAQMGSAVTPSPIRPTLRGVLLTGIAPTYLRAQIGGSGDPVEIAASPLWWPPSKVAGRYLAPYLAGHNALAGTETLQELQPSTQKPASIEKLHDEARRLALSFAERDAADGQFESALDWLDVLVQIDGVLPSGYLGKRADWQGRAVD
jgi:sulfide:quinone oxidoreductase